MKNNNQTRPIDYPTDINKTYLHTSILFNKRLGTLEDSPGSPDFVRKSPRLANKHKNGSSSSKLI